MVWHKHSTVVYRRGEQLKTGKIAGFDLDSTLIYSDRGEQIAKKGFVWAYINVVETVRSFYQNGYTIVIFSNRQGTYQMVNDAKSLVDKIIAYWDVPAWCFFATRKDEYRKPNRGMFDLFISLNPIAIDLKQSFYCGDAVGKDSLNKWWRWSDSDKQFAESLQIEFKPPTDVFQEFPIPTLNEEIKAIITVGNRGSGWEDFEPFIGMTFAIDKNEDYAIMDTTLTIPKSKKKLIYYIIGANPTQQERQKIIDTLGLKSQEVVFHVYFRPPYDKKVSLSDYSEQFECPDNCVRIN